MKRTSILNDTRNNSINQCFVWMKVQKNACSPILGRLMRGRRFFRCSTEGKQVDELVTLEHQLWCFQFLKFNDNHCNSAMAGEGNNYDQRVDTEEEREHFLKIIQAFKSYKTFANNLVLRRLSYIETLPETQQTALSRYKTSLQEILKCVALNHQIIEMITEDADSMFENPLNHSNNFRIPRPKVTLSDVDKVQVTLKQIYRDWTDDGVIERIQCYQPILDELEELFPSSLSEQKNSKWSRSDLNVLVPGAGLGRLAFEIATLGFSCEGNEFSLYMLFASNFILNKCPDVKLHKIYPWVMSCDNNLSSDSLLASVVFPDVNPTNLNEINSDGRRFSMVAGDFLEVYQKENEWDCVATCFFIDCANNVCTFIEKIFTILKPGGFWINLGPLQYHFSNSTEEESIEPTFEDVKLIIESAGFKLLRETTKLPTLYCQNRRSMLKQHYESVFFTCEKPNSPSL
ncbi:unnamed protein product [Nesidiocoris tenuis]|uniref:carnosine N-methyltransferase n=1 Tax=Nesidiocoris tenuis TaxID=355587 RepID=A0A6H5GVX7_9HEMI|nr:unnamed protein product [Nesidiocoris tenuis]